MWVASKEVRLRIYQKGCNRMPSYRASPSMVNPPRPQSQGRFVLDRNVTWMTNSSVTARMLASPRTKGLGSTRSPPLPSAKEYTGDGRLTARSRAKRSSGISRDRSSDHHTSWPRPTRGGGAITLGFFLARDTPRCHTDDINKMERVKQDSLIRETRLRPQVPRPPHNHVAILYCMSKDHINRENQDRRSC
jgi:hypothetical protein